MPGYLGKMPPALDDKGEPLLDEYGEPYCVGDRVKPLHSVFLLVSFVFDGKSYYRYRWRIFITGMINVVVNILFERVVIKWLEWKFDRRFKEKRAQNLKITTETHKA